MKENVCMLEPRAVELAVSIGYSTADINFQLNLTRQRTIHRCSLPALLNSTAFWFQLTLALPTSYCHAQFVSETVSRRICLFFAYHA